MVVVGLVLMVVVLAATAELSVAPVVEQKTGVRRFASARESITSGWHFAESTRAPGWEVPASQAFHKSTLGVLALLQ